MCGGGHGSFRRKKEQDVTVGDSSRMARLTVRESGRRQHIQGYMYLQDGGMGISRE